MRLEPLESGRRAEVLLAEEHPQTQPGPWWLLAILIFGGWGVLSISVAWWGAPGRYRRLVESARIHARDQREAWNRQGYVSAVPDHIERAAPFRAMHIDDAATILGRLLRREPGVELDVKATVAATLDAGGRMTLVHGASRQREHLLVLVDRDHLYLDGVEWLLARWRRVGLRVLRYDYHNTLGALRHEHGSELSLDALRGQTEGLPLLIFSRMRGARGYKGSVALTRTLYPWPVRAWLDLDPTPLKERDRERERLVRTLESSGLPRYPFTESGLVAAARGLAEGFPRHRVLPDVVLAPTADLDLALMVWAGTVACVPDASWAQLDALRRHFGGFAELTPDGTPLDARALERLLAWISARRYHSGVLGEGTRLYFTRAGRRALLKALRRHDHERWPDDPDARHEARVRRLLSQQLMAADLGVDPYRRALRDMKVAMHEAILDPTRADALLPGFADKAVAYELMEQLQDELTLQADDAAFDRRWSTRTREALIGYIQGDERARLPDLLGRPRLDARQVVAALLLITLSAGSWALWWTNRPTTRTVEQIRFVEMPPSWKVVAGTADGFVALADAAPMHFRMLPGGTFDMGSPQAERDQFIRLYPTVIDESDFADERLHTVSIGPFELAVTEVTNAQWRTVMGVTPSDCEYHCGDNHPVQNVSWIMAVEYLNKLTERENTRLPLAGHRTRCYEQRGDTWEWVKGCTGYRLPSEAEWEYAVRAGTTTAYNFGGDLEDLCTHVNGADLAAKREHSAWTVNATCDDGAANMAEVDKYPANSWGLQGMHGNAWEWVWDWYDEKYADGGSMAISPRGPQDGNDRVLRGGSIREMPWGLRSANRSSNAPANALAYWGFRCARDSSPVNTGS